MGGAYGDTVPVCGVSSPTPFSLACGPCAWEGDSRKEKETPWLSSRVSKKRVALSSETVP